VGVLRGTTYRPSYNLAGHPYEEYAI